MVAKRTIFWSVLAVAALSVGVAWGAEGCSCGGCSGSSCGGACGGQAGCGSCTQTVMVPQWVTETRKVMTTECVPETRHCTYTVTRCIPETSNVVREYTVMVPETRTRTETFQVQVPTTRNVTEQYQVCVPAYRDVVRHYTVCVPVWTQQQQQYTVMVPYTETRQATRQVCECVPVAETRHGVPRLRPLGAAGGLPIELSSGGCSSSGCSSGGCSSGGCSSGGCSAGGCSSGGVAVLRRLRVLYHGLGPECCPRTDPSDRHAAASQRSALPILRHALPAGNPLPDGQRLQLSKRNADLHREGLRVPQRDADSDVLRARLPLRDPQPASLLHRVRSAEADLHRAGGQLSQRVRAADRSLHGHGAAPGGTGDLRPGLPPGAATSRGPDVLWMLRQLWWMLRHLLRPPLRLPGLVSHGPMARPGAQQKACYPKVIDLVRRGSLR